MNSDVKITKRVDMTIHNFKLQIDIQTFLKTSNMAYIKHLNGFRTAKFFFNMIPRNGQNKFRMTRDLKIPSASKHVTFEIIYTTLSSLNKN